MLITMRAQYAVLATAYLNSLKTTQFTTTAHIAEEQDIPHIFLAKILAGLKSHGLVEAKRGAGGGVRLPPNKRITVLNVIEAVDGPIQLVSNDHNKQLSDVFSQPEQTLKVSLNKPF